MCFLLFSCTREENGLTINIPGIFLFTLVVIAYWITYHIITKNMEMEAIPHLLLGIALTFFYVFYSIWWLCVNWDSIGLPNIPFHIRIT